MCRICSLSSSRLEAFYSSADVPPVCEGGAAVLKAELRERLAAELRAVSGCDFFPRDAIATLEAEHAEAWDYLVSKLDEASSRFRGLAA